MKFNQKGFSVAEILIVTVVIGLIATVGWLVYDRQKSKPDIKDTTTQPSQQENKQDETLKQEEPKSNVPEGWVQYQDTTSGVSFYYPEDWDKSKFHVHKAPVSEAVKGTNFGPYSAKYVFKKAENKWYQLDMEDNIVQPHGYRTDTTFPVSSYPAVYGYTGEGGGTSYYAAFTDGTSAYLIELPSIIEETDPNGLAKQKQAITNLVATIKIGI